MASSIWLNGIKYSSFTLAPHFSLFLFADVLENLESSIAAASTPRAPTPPLTPSGFHTPPHSLPPLPSNILHCVTFAACCLPFWLFLQEACIFHVRHVVFSSLCQCVYAVRCCLCVCVCAVSVWAGAPTLHFYRLNCVSGCEMQVIDLFVPAKNDEMLFRFFRSLAFISLSLFHSFLFWRSGSWAGQQLWTAIHRLVFLFLEFFG